MGNLNNKTTDTKGKDTTKKDDDIKDTGTKEPEAKDGTIKTVKAFPLADAGKKADEEVKIQNGEGSKIGAEPETKTKTKSSNIIDLALNKIGAEGIKVDPFGWADTYIETVISKMVSQPKVLDEFLDSYKTEILKVLNKSRATESNVKEIFNIIYTSLIKIYISNLTESALNKTKETENDLMKLSFARLCGYSKIKFNEDVYNDMLSSKLKLFNQLTDYIDNHISKMVMFNETGIKDWSIILDVKFNSMSAIQYLEKCKKTFGSRYEHVINNVIQRIDDTEIFLFRPDFVNFGYDSHVPDSYLKNDSDPTYIGYLGVIEYGMWDSCINKEDRAVRKFFIDCGVITPNQDEIEEEDDNVNNKSEIEKENINDKTKKAKSLTLENDDVSARKLLSKLVV